MVRGIDNIGICSSDLARSVAFYQKLGFSEAYRNDRVPNPLCAGPLVCAHNLRGASTARVGEQTFQKLLDAALQLSLALCQPVKATALRQ